MVRTRIWQVLFVLEVIIAAPQGRTDFAVDVETVDFTVPVPSPELDPFEQQTSRRFAYFSQSFRLIKRTNTLWVAMRQYRKG